MREREREQAKRERERERAEQDGPRGEEDGLLLRVARDRADRILHRAAPSNHPNAGRGI